MNPLDELLGPVSQAKPPRRGGTAREMRAAMASGQQVSFAAAPQQAEVGSLGALAANIGSGVTAGLSNIPAAGVMQATRSMTGGAPLTFSEALQEVRRSGRETAKQYPAASALGQLGGSAILTGLTGGGSLPAQIGKGAVQGGVAGAMAAETPSDAATAAAIGAGTTAGLTGLLGGAGRIVRMSPMEEASFIRNYYMGRQADIAEKFRERGLRNFAETEPILAKWQNLKGPITTQDEAMAAMEAIRKAKSSTLNRAGISKEEQTIIRDSLSSSSRMKKAEERLSTMTALRPEREAERAQIYKQARGSLSFSPMNIAREEMGTLRGMAPDIALGVATGAGGALAAGQDPFMGAAIGAGLGGLYDIRQRGVPRIMQSLPAAAAVRFPGYTQQVMPAAAGVGRVTGQQVAGVLPPQAPMEQQIIDTTDLDELLGPITPTQPTQPPAPQSGLGGLLTRLKTEGFQQ